jgi:hypothetical protein
MSDMEKTSTLELYIILSLNEIVVMPEFFARAKPLKASISRIYEFVVYHLDFRPDGIFSLPLIEN